jgi:predicted flap endonuclease-1-like 5' DNA nuclease
LADSSRSGADALSRVAFWASAILFGFAGPLGWRIASLTAPSIESAHSMSLCESPREAHAEAGWTREVACGESRENASPLRGPAILLFGGKLDLNRAEARELEVLPGIGPARARAIVEARCDAPFRRVADLQRIRGIGPVTTSALGRWAEVKEVTAALIGEHSSVGCGDLEAVGETPRRSATELDD